MKSLFKKPRTKVTAVPILKSSGRQLLHCR